jgi:hypothetical protein
MLLYPGQFYQYGFALVLVNHAKTNVTVVADLTAVAKA